MGFDGRWGSMGRKPARWPKACQDSWWVGMGIDVDTLRAIRGHTKAAKDLGADWCTDDSAIDRWPKQEALSPLKLLQNCFANFYVPLGLGG